MSRLFSHRYLTSAFSCCRYALPPVREEPSFWDRSPDRTRSQAHPVAASVLMAHPMPISFAARRLTTPGPKSSVVVAWSTRSEYICEEGVSVSSNGKRIGTAPVSGSTMHVMNCREGSSTWDSSARNAARITER